MVLNVLECSMQWVTAWNSDNFHSKKIAEYYIIQRVLKMIKKYLDRYLQRE